MTTLSSTSITASQTPAIPRGRVGLVALWLTQIALAAMFLFAGGLKLTGVPQLVALFDAIGIGQWLRYVTGSIEVVSAVALLVPGWAAFGALLLIPTMVGAVITQRRRSTSIDRVFSRGTTMTWMCWEEHRRRTMCRSSKTSQESSSQPHTRCLTDSRMGVRRRRPSSCRST
jgi:putative oxidoreductase